MAALAQNFGGVRGKLFAGTTAVAIPLALALGGLAATANNAYAQDATLQPAATAQELADLSEANRAAFSYAREHGVAILIHVGMDIQNHEQPEALLAWVENEFETKFAEHGINVGIFPRMNDSAGTGLVYHVGEHIYTPPGKESPILGLQQAAELVPNVAEQGQLALELKVSEAGPENPAPHS